MRAASTSDAALARALVSDITEAALATLAEGGGPFASYVTTAPAEDGSPLLLLSKLAAHSRNLARDPRASLLLVSESGTGSDAMTKTRLTLTGRMLAERKPASRDLFLQRHPDAGRYAGFADFALYRFDVVSGHLVAGFGRIVTLARADLLRPAEEERER